MRYGISKYGEHGYGEENIHDVNRNNKKYKLNLFEQLPYGLYGDSQNTINMSEINAYETTINKALSDIDTLENEITLINATNIGISRREDMHGIKTNKSRPNKHRISAAISKARGIGVITKKVVESMAAAFSNGEVKVIEPEDAHIIIKFIGIKGIPPNMDDLMNTLNDMLPAHVLYEFSYRFTTCLMLKDWNVNCNDIKKVTCTELKTYEKKFNFAYTTCKYLIDSNITCNDIKDITCIEIKEFGRSEVI